MYLRWCKWQSISDAIVEFKMKIGQCMTFDIHNLAVFLPFVFPNI